MVSSAALALPLRELEDRFWSKRAGTLERFALPAALASRPFGYGVTGVAEGVAGLGSNDGKGGKGGGESADVDAAEAAEEAAVAGSGVEGAAALGAWEALAYADERAAASTAAAGTDLEALAEQTLGGGGGGGGGVFVRATLVALDKDCGRSPVRRAARHTARRTARRTAGDRWTDDTERVSYSSLLCSLCGFTLLFLLFGCPRVCAELLNEHERQATPRG